MSIEEMAEGRKRWGWRRTDAVVGSISTASCSPEQGVEEALATLLAPPPINRVEGGAFLTTVLNLGLTQGARPKPTSRPLCVSSYSPDPMSARSEVIRDLKQFSDRSVELLRVVRNVSMGEGNAESPEGVMKQLIATDSSLQDAVALCTSLLFVIHHLYASVNLDVTCQD